MSKGTHIHSPAVSGSGVMVVHRTLEACSLLLEATIVILPRRVAVYPDAA
ncbi:MAG: hypothetical protein ACRES7_02085 [Gammaproteobacteria bacterium]